MRLLIDANIILDCLVLEKTGLPRAGRTGSGFIIDLCDRKVHDGLVAWHTLPIISYYHRRQNTEPDTASMMDELLATLEVPRVGHADAEKWRTYGVPDFEDALQVAAALAGNADCIITRNVADFAGASMDAMTPEDFLLKFPP
ncbi:MAG: PIN domain-containing protein [Verrucomicrobiaceae bacterium]|nr:MAG: PIN domain-containing protein [Verrucomicrobiaceae bacterium]